MRETFNCSYQILNENIIHRVYLLRGLKIKEQDLTIMKIYEKKLNFHLFFFVRRRPDKSTVERSGSSTNSNRSEVGVGDTHTSTLKSQVQVSEGKVNSVIYYNESCLLYLYSPFYRKIDAFEFFKISEFSLSYFFLKMKR